MPPLKWGETILRLIGRVKTDWDEKALWNSQLIYDKLASDYSDRFCEEGGRFVQ